VEHGKHFNFYNTERRSLTAIRPIFAVNKEELVSRKWFAHIRFILITFTQNLTTMRKPLFTLMLLLFGLVESASAAIYHVNLNAAGANNGTSWTDAFVDLQDAISISVFGDEIWVAQGVYKPTTGTSRSSSFVIKNGTQVYGGFNGTETDLNQRNVAVHTTVLSGEIGSGSASDNSYRVVRFSNVANQTRLDGFTITAAYNNQGGSSYGGGASSTASSPIIANCIFSGNYCSVGGGAINHSTSGILTLQNCVFDGNVGNTYGGGALRLYAGTINVSNCYFKSNQSDTYGGAIFLYEATLNISNSVFAGNIAQTTGSAIRVSDIGTLHLSNSLVVGNFAEQSGAITSSTFSNTSAHTIKNCTIAHNKQVNSTGSSLPCAVALNDEALVTNSIIYGNSNSIQILSTGLTFNNSITQSATNNATGTNVQYVDPQFILPGDVNNAPFDTTGLNYRMDLLSAGIDAGLNANASGSFDLSGNPRIHNNTIDLGAYEESFCVSSSEFTSNTPYTICGGTPITLEVNDGVEFVWSNGSTSSAINVNSAGTYSVIFIDDDGCRGDLSATVTSSTNPAPTINFSGGSLNVANFSSYQWSFNGSPISGATTNAHIPIQGYGEYQVEVTNATGCSGNSTFCLSPAELNANGPTTFCSGNSVILTASNGTSYVWSTGSLNPAITVNSSGTYTVNVFNADAGCSVLLQQQVTVNPNPNPAVTFNGTTFNTGTFSSYQWNFNSNPISGAANQTYNPISTGNGQYSVTVTNAQGCEATSMNYNLTNLSLNNYENQEVSLFPNPIATGGLLTVELGSNYLGNNEIQIFGLTGALVLESTSSGNHITLRLPNLEAGLYLVRIVNESNIISEVKLVIMR